MLEKVFGANVDWISQHSVFPEYFRQQFYATGDLFPEFAANIGGGQNLYHFSYYGLYNPLYLPAYVLPFVKMSDYIMAVSILCLFADVVLFYQWLRGNEVSKGNAALTSFMFLLAGPMIFHSYNQIMFINYMPFLILGFMGVELFFRKGKSGVLIISVFLMIMTSFYFSVGGILVLILYGVYQYWKVQEEKGEKITVRRFLVSGIKFCIPILTGILLSGILLVPTAMVLLNGERKGREIKEILSLFLPNLRMFRVLYQPYGIGLTTCIITVLLTGLTYKKWREKYLSIGCILLLTLPIFSYLLNGGLYIRDKAFIPVLPLLCYLMAMYLEKQRRREIPFTAGMISLILTLVFVWVGDIQKAYASYRCLIVLDAAVMLICGLIYYRKGTEKLFVFVPIIFLLVFNAFYHEKMDRMLDKSFYEQVTDSKYHEMVENILQNEKGFYRLEQNGTSNEEAANLNQIWSMKQYSSSIYSSTYNAEYQRFRQKIFDVEQPYRNVLMQGQAKNPIFQRLMGIKYILSDEDVPGYEKITEGIYQRNDVLPIAYGTDQVMSQTEYEKLKFPYNQTAFLSNVVVQGKKEEKEDVLKKEQNENLREIEIDLEKLKETSQDKIILPEAEEGELFFLQFDIKNHRLSKDVWVSVNGIRNKLTAKNHFYYNENETFTYAMTLEKGQTEIPIDFRKGKYEIKNVKGYLWKMTEDSPFQSEFIVDQKNTKGNRIVGTIEMQKSGYFVTSIPYDVNFTVKTDGRETVCEQVNTAFLGFPIEKGTHEIEIVYHAPGVMAGKVLSVLGMLLCLVLFRRMQKIDKNSLIIL